MLSMFDSILSMRVSMPLKSSLFVEDELLPPPLSELLSFDPREQAWLNCIELDWLL
jgi:hypothetical protein